MEESYERGWGVKSGGDLDHTVFIYSNGNSQASIIHAESFVKTLEYVYENREEALEKAKLARKWAEANSWERRESEWQQLLQMIQQRQAAYRSENALQSTTTS
jgi:hypothetical protein